MADEKAPASNEQFADDIFSKHPGVFAWIFGIVVGVGFIGALYLSAGGDHGGGHGGDHAEEAGH